MQATAMVNYHVTSDKQQAFHIDANGEKGKIVSPELAPTQVKVKDVRDGNIQLNFWEDSLLYVQSPSVIKDFTQSQDWRETYNAELSRLLAEQLGAKEVIIFDHTIRIDDPDSDRKPARNVHSDYSACGAIKRLEDILGAEEAKKWHLLLLTYGVLFKRLLSAHHWVLSDQKVSVRKIGYCYSLSIQIVSGRSWG